MPYITADQKKALNNGYRSPENAGELNYAFTLLAREYWLRNRNYQGINDIVGALEGAKAEFQRRIVAQYEDTKIAINGDVYT